MERMLLTKEVRAMKEKMLDYVNDIIVRQNRQDPVSNFESFLSETAARKALKELLEEFTTGVEDVRKRCGSNDEKLALNKATIERHDHLLKKVEEKADAVDTFHKRLLACETKLETAKELMEKRHESTKDLVQRTKDMLEARVDQITQYNSRLEAMQESIAKVKDVTNLFQENITGQMNQANEKVQRLEGVLHEFMDE
jgi:wobble nucleotide-excising tRNase